MRFVKRLTNYTKYVINIEYEANCTLSFVYIFSQIAIAIAHKLLFYSQQFRSSYILQLPIFFYILASFVLFFFILYTHFIATASFPYRRVSRSQPSSFFITLTQSSVTFLYFLFCIASLKIVGCLSLNKQERIRLSIFSVESKRYWRLLNPYCLSLEHHLVMIIRMCFHEQEVLVMKVV